MTLDEAIQNLVEEAEFEQEEENQIMVDSIKIGIEALKTIQRYRSFVAVDAVRLLPGED